jgi:hypothetical protein
LRVINAHGRAVADTRQKIRVKTVACKFHPDLSPAGDKFVQPTLREPAILTTQIVHSIDFIQ